VSRDKRDRGGQVLEELRALISFLQHLWGMLAGISVLFPLSNEFFRVIPLKSFDEEGVYIYFSPRLITAIATLVSLFTVLASFASRKTLTVTQRRAWLSFIIGVVFLLLYLIGYSLSLHVYSLMGIESDDPRRLMLELPLLAFYSFFFALVTRAFILLGLLEFYRAEE